MSDDAAPEFPAAEIKRYLREAARLMADYHATLNRLYPESSVEKFGGWWTRGWVIDVDGAIVEFRCKAMFGPNPERQAENERRFEEYERRLAGETDDDPQAP